MKPKPDAFVLIVDLKGIAPNVDIKIVKETSRESELMKEPKTFHSWLDARAVSSV